MEIPQGRLGRQFAVGNRDYFVTWNKREVLQFDATGGEGTATKDTEQLIYIANEVPETFSVFLLARRLDGASLGANTLLVTFTLNIGVGTSMIRVPYGIAFNSTLAQPTDVYDLLTTPQTVGYKTLEFPVQQINATASVQVNGTTDPLTVEVFATAAPRFKAHYLRETPAYVPGEGGAP
jgi:hypothetical protein